MGLTRPRAYQIFDIDYKQSVRVVTVSNVTLGGGAPSQVDGVSLSLNDRVLVTGQSTGSQNGLYYVTTVGTGSNGTWQRSIDGNETGEIDAGMVVMVTEGLVYADTQWKLTTNDPIVIGSTALTFVQNYSANSVSAGTSNVVVTSNANVSIATGGSNVAVFTVGGPHQFTGNLNPTSNVTYSLGNATSRWKDIYLANNSIYLGNVTLSADANQLLVNSANVVTATANGAITTSGNITGSYFIGNGSQLTGVVATGVTAITNGTTNITAGASANANITVAGTSNVVVFSTSGANVTGYVTATGNITSSYFIGNGYTITSVNASNVSGTVANATYATSAGSATTATSATTAGTVTTASQPNITSVGTLSSLTVTGNITGGNVSAGTGTISVGGLTLNGNTIISSGPTLTIDPNGSGGVDGQVTIAGNLQVTGNVTYINSNVITVNDLLINVANNAATASAANGAGLGVGPVDAEYAKLTYNSTSNTWVISNGANVSGVVTATGNITGSYFIGNGSTLTSLTGANVTGTVANATYATSAGSATTATSATTAGTVTTAAQPNITSVGTLSSLAVTGNITAGNLTGATLVSATNLTGTLTTAAQTNITSVGTLTSLAVTGNTTSGNFVGTLNGSGANVTSISATNISSGTLAQARLANASIIIGNTTSTLGATVTAITGLTSVTSTTFVGALTGAATSATTAGTVTTAAQPNITSVGTLTSLAVTGNTTSGNFVGTLNGSGANVTLISATNISSGTLAQARLANSAVTLGSTALTLGSTVTTVAGLTSVTSTTFVGSLSGAATTAGTVTTAAQPNITSTGTLSSLSVTGNITSSTGHVGTIYTNSIINTGANATGNIGSSTLYFNTAFVKATSAQYADLAEMYVADANYAPGTVVEFGGDYEITQTTSACSTAVAGIISTNPSYLMNSCQEGEHVLPVALTGRVPCQVLGPVKKGDVLISSNVPGVAQRIGANWQPGCTVGKAMEDISESVVKVIEVAVGRL